MVPLINVLAVLICDGLRFCPDRGLPLSRVYSHPNEPKIVSITASCPLFITATAVTEMEPAAPAEVDPKIGR